MTGERGVFATLRQPRYAALGVLMIVVALVCVACGVWQIYRFESKRDANEHLRHNAELSAASTGAVLPVLGQGNAPGRDAVEYRQLRVTGRYDGANETLVRGRTDGDDTGFLVLTPLRTSGATLLVVRGFLKQPSTGAIPAAPQPPSGRVTLTARAQVPETRNDQYQALDERQVQSINPTQQVGRLGGTIYNGYAQLEAGQPGSEGLTDLERPDLSNPAGGALEPQHFAYVIQWFLFALLALAAPFAMARAENKRRDSGEFDTVEPEIAPTVEPTPEETRAAKLTAPVRTSGALSMPFDAHYWDERYRGTDSVWGTAPNRWVQAECADLAVGTAVDLACGEGRNAAWLASLGWQVFAVDFSAVALAKGAEHEPTGRVTWVLDDALDFRCPSPVDLVVVAYLQLPPDLRRKAMRNAAAALAPGGTLIVVAPRRPQPHRWHGRAEGSRRALHRDGRRARPRAARTADRARRRGAT